MPELNMSSIPYMSHMFENCYSLISLNLSNFNLNLTQNTENMFANDINLVHIKFQQADFSNIKNTQNMFLSTLNNMVFCFNENVSNISTSLDKNIQSKGCFAIDCSSNWIKSRKLINAETGQCVEECSQPFVFFYDYKCYKKCPIGTFPNEFFCVDEIGDIGDDCTVNKYFKNLCRKKLNTPKLKQKFIEEIINDFKKGKLYDIALTAIEDKKKFIRYEENETYSIFAIANKERESNTTFIEMESCVKILTRIYRVSYDDLIIFKIEYYDPNFKIPIIEYALFTQYGTRRVSLNSCINSKINYYIPKKIPDYNEYLYNPANDYYYNSCNIKEKINDTVLTLFQRRNMFNNNNLSLCENNCIFQHFAKNTIHCKCNIKMKFNSFMNMDVNKYNLVYRFNINDKININTWVVKCILLLSSNFDFTNIFSLIILLIIFYFFICSIIFPFKGKKTLFNKIKNLMKSTQNKKNKDIHQKPKIVNKKEKRNNLISFFNNKSSRTRIIPRLNINNLTSNKINKKNKKSKKSENVMEKTYNELNYLSYNDALLEESRTLSQYYCSLIITKNILIFTFNCKEDYNSKLIKSCFILYNLINHVLLNTLFITETTFQDLFISQGKIMFHNYIKIIIITIIMMALKNILIFLIFTESSILSMKNYQTSDKRKAMLNLIYIITIKCKLFFVFGLLSLLLFWIYITCFFMIFQNIQFFVLINSLISFGISLLLPVIFGFIPGIIRFYSLSNKQTKSRLFSYYLSQIIQSIL